MELIILKYTPHQHAYVVAFFDLQVPSWGVLFRQWKIIKTKAGKQIVVPPKFKRGEDENGQGIYIPYISFSKEVYQSFMDSLYKGLKEHHKFD